MGGPLNKLTQEHLHMKETGTHKHIKNLSSPVKREKHHETAKQTMKWNWFLVLFTDTNGYAYSYLWHHFPRVLRQLWLLRMRSSALHAQIRVFPVHHTGIIQYGKIGRPTMPQAADKKHIYMLE